jgi:flagellar motor component MotA
MNRTEFVEKYNTIVGKAVESAEKARREGLLALEDDIDDEKVNARDIFEYGLCFVIDGTNLVVIDEILSNIINQEKDEQLRTLMNIQKRAVLSIQAGDNLRLLYPLLNSFTDIPLNEDKNRIELLR